MDTYIVKQINRKNGVIINECEFLICNDACDYALNEGMKHLWAVFEIYKRTNEGDVFLTRV